MTGSIRQGFFHRNRFALTGVALGLLGVAVCAVATALGYREHDGMFAFGRNTDGNRLGVPLRVAGGVLGFGALVTAVIGWIRHEHPRVWLGALFLATAALAWEYVMVAVVIAFLLLVLGSALSAS